jgi:hypothetical protein
MKRMHIIIECFTKRRSEYPGIVAVYQAHLLTYLCVLLRVNSPGKNYQKQ